MKNGLQKNQHVQMAKKNIKRYAQLVFGLRQMNLNSKREKTKKTKTVSVYAESLPI